MRKWKIWVLGAAFASAMLFSVGNPQVDVLAAGTVESGLLEEEMTSKLAAAGTDKVSSVITDANLYSVVKAQAGSGLSDAAFTYDKLRQYTGVLDLSTANFTVIPANAFADCKFSGVILPDSVTAIQDQAFSGCASLKYVHSVKGGTTFENTLPSALTDVGIQVFVDCAALKEITIAPVQGDAIKNAVSMFSGCSGLTKVIIGDKVTIIPSSAFNSCGAKGSGIDVRFGSGLEKIMDNAFFGSTLTDTLDLSGCGSLVEIQKAAFRDVKNLTTVKLPTNTKELKIGDQVFATNKEIDNMIVTMGAGTSPVQDKIVLPEYVVELGNGCFLGNTQMTEIQLSSNITYIGEYTFDGCVKLENISFTGNKSKATYIGDCAFRSTMTDAAFLQYMTSLKTIGSQHIVEAKIKSGNDLNSLPLGGEEGKNVVLGSDGQKTYKNKPCGSEVFTNCPNIKSVIIPASVEEVGSRAFYFDTSKNAVKSAIQSIEWKTDNASSNKRTIYTEAFRGNTVLETMILPANDSQILEIQGQAFYGDEKLSKLSTDGSNVLSKSVSMIGWGAFYNCKALKKVTIQNMADGNAPVLGKMAFESCESLSGLVLPSAITEIPLRCFANCGLTAFPTNLPNLNKIGELAFFGNPFITLDLSGLPNIVDISGCAFADEDCIATSSREESNYNKTIYSHLLQPVLTTVILPAKTAYQGERLFINTGTFAGQTEFNTMKLPGGNSDVIYIPDYMVTPGKAVFLGCGVTHVVYEADSTGTNRWINIPVSTFEDCGNIAKAEDVLPTGNYVTALGKGLFYGSSIKSADLSRYTELTTVGSGTVVTQAMGGVFGACEELVSVKFPTSAFTIENYCFYIPNGKIAALSSVDLGGAVSISDYAFSNQRVLKKITMKEGVTSIGKNAFENCLALQTVDVAGTNHITLISDNAFKNCESLVLTGSKLLDGPGAVNANAFTECDMLGEVHIGNSIKTIGSNAFSKSGMTKIDFSDAVALETIGSNAFYATKLTEFDISGTKVAKIDSGLLKSCRWLENVSFGNEIEYIFSDAMAGCVRLSSVEVAATTAIHPDVFKSQGETSKDDENTTLYTAQNNGKTGNLTLKIRQPEQMVVPIGRNVDLPFFVTLNDTTTPSYSYVLVEPTVNTDAAVIDTYLKVNGALTDGFYKNRQSNDNKITDEQYYEGMEVPYKLTMKRGGTELKNIETIRLEGKKATANPIKLTLKGELSFNTADRDGYKVNVADYGVTYTVSVQDIPFVPVLYSDRNKTVEIVADDEREGGALNPIRLDAASANPNVPVYKSFVDKSGAGGVLTGADGKELKDIVVETDNPAVAYAAKNANAKAEELMETNGDNFYIKAAGIGTATIKAYPKGCPNYARTWTYSVDSYIKTMRLIVPEAYRSGAAVGDTYNVFEYYDNYFGQRASVDNPESYTQYSGHYAEIIYESGNEEYVAVDQSGNITVLKADDRAKQVQVTATYPTADGRTAKASVNITIAKAGTVTPGGNEPGTGGTQTAVNEPVIDSASGAEAVVTVVGNGDLEGEVKYTKPLDGNASQVVIPDTVMVNGIRYKVTTIDANAFKNNKKITKITLGQYITEIGAQAFSGCTALKQVVIPASVKKIGKKAFYNCSKLTKVTIPSASALTEIGDSAFYNCKALTAITIPKKVKTIQAKAFYNCKKLKKITIKSTVLKKVGKNAFKNIHKKAVIKVPKSKLSAYKKLLKGKGQKKSVKIKK